MIVPDNVQHCKHNMEGVKDVESSEEIVKTDLFLVKQNNNRQNVPCNNNDEKVNTIKMQNLPMIPKDPRTIITYPMKFE